MANRIHPQSVLFVVLDSCRFDTFAQSELPNMKAVGPLHQAQAPSYFTYGSHAAMFVGFTPGVAQRADPLLNPKFSKLFKIAGAGFPGKGQEGFSLEGRSIIDGFRRQGYATIGSGAVGWFDPNTETGRLLSADFEHFFFPGNTHALGRQLRWLDEQIAAAGDVPLFLFLNIGETHVPYYFEGAPWSVSDNPCRPFQAVDRAEECRMRQRACCEFIDARLAPLLHAFAHATTLICADHGDCWGEDGLWEHGISHAMTLTVPLLIRRAGAPVH